MPDTSGANPYVGPRPFQPEESDRFFGRDRETRELLSHVLAHRVVLLYAASGAGKTSLLNASVLPRLEQEEHFDVLPSARIGHTLADDVLPAGISNVFAFATLESLGAEPTPDLTLVGFLDAREQRTGPDGFPAPRALVIDQFEELFTAFPARWPERAGFVTQLAEAIEADPLLRVLLAIREDHVAEMDAVASLLPGGLRTRFRLDRLAPEAAKQAVIEPLAGTKRSFAPGAVEKLVTDLRALRLDPEAGERIQALGEYVEPVQLQVACRSLWDSLPDSVGEITEEDLREFGDVDQVLAEFYGEAVRAAAAVPGASEPRLRRWIGSELITSVGTRGTVHRAAASTVRIPERAIDELVDWHLLRSEWRAGSHWYELTHDRLIAPIQASNDRYFARRTRRRSLAALGVALLLAAAALAAVFTLWAGGDSASAESVHVLSPQAVDFGRVAQGGSTTRTFTFSSSVSARVMRVVTASRVFTWASGCGDVAAGSGCPITVTFAPERVGLARATLVVHPEAGDPLKAALRGFGQSKAGPTLTPTAVDFGDVAVRRRSSKRVSLAAGSRDLRIVSVSTSGEGFSVYAACPDLLEAEHTCPITVTFAPLNAGQQSASFVIATRGGANLIGQLEGRGIRSQPLPPPRATITAGPSSPGVGEASFSFVSDQASSSFLCSLDGAAFAPCSSPITYSGVSPPRHTFRVKAKNENGIGPPAVSSWSQGAG